MYCTDFEYDGKILSNYGGSICCITDGGGSAEAVSIGNELTFNTVNNTTSNKFRMGSATYGECYTTTFQIGKINCDNDDISFTPEEIAFYMRWLNRKDYHKLRFIYDEGEMANVYFMATFNLQPISLGYDVVGFELTMTTDAPYGYYDDVGRTITCTEDNLKFKVLDTSDEIGKTYVKMRITPTATTEEFKLSNPKMKKEMILTDMLEDDYPVVIDGISKIIEVADKASDVVYPNSYAGFSEGETVVSAGITYTDNGDYTITINGTPTATETESCSTLYLIKDQEIPEGWKDKNIYVCGFPLDIKMCVKVVLSLKTESGGESLTELSVYDTQQIKFDEKYSTYSLYIKITTDSTVDSSYVAYVYTDKSGNETIYYVGNNGGIYDSTFKYVAELQGTFDTFSTAQKYLNSHYKTVQYFICTEEKETGQETANYHLYMTQPKDDEGNLLDWIYYTRDTSKNPEDTPMFTDVVLPDLYFGNHALSYNNFNFVFPYLVNDMDDEENTFTVSSPCEILLTYTPIAKLGYL